MSEDKDPEKPKDDGPALGGRVRNALGKENKGTSDERAFFIRKRAATAARRARGRRK